ncbi:hypothetical protein NC652_027555 [Populus alba x Populus x berolinensis]|nr:hypothetical protein NC652_027555 [Populus alba x Populus x berolinensis]
MEKNRHESCNAIGTRNSLSTHPFFSLSQTRKGQAKTSSSTPSPPPSFFTISFLSPLYRIKKQQHPLPLSKASPIKQNPLQFFCFPKKMPAQKRSYETVQKEDDALLRQQQDHTNNNHEQKQEPRSDIDDDGGVESDRSQPSSSINEDVKEEYVVVKLSEIRKEVQCPICLGIIRKTRTVMECLHRFCRECIDKSMRLGYQNLVSLNDSSPLMSL